jgi:hypothetical protein
MENERLLRDVAVHDSWLHMAHADYSRQEVIEHISFFLAASVVRLEWSTVDDLRDRVHWANDLDRNAVALGTIFNMQADDLREAAARRIVHHSARHALEQIKSRRLRQNFCVNTIGFDEHAVSGYEASRLGMGRRELKDIRMADDFAEQG